MPLVMTLDGPDEILASGIQSFARQNGWNEESEKTYLEFSRDVMASYIKENIKAFNSAEAARQASAAALVATDAALQGAILSVELVENT